MLRTIFASEPDTKVIVASPTPFCVKVTMEPSIVTATTPGLLDTAVKVSAVAPSSWKAATLITKASLLVVVSQVGSL